MCFSWTCCPPLQILMGSIEKDHLAHNSQCMGTDFVSSCLQTRNINRLKCDDTVSDVVKKLLSIIWKQIQCTVKEKASKVSILFTFKQGLISYFATYNQQATNYRVDIPWVLQRFSINCKTVSQTMSFWLLELCVRVYISVHTWILSCSPLCVKCMQVHCKSEFMHAGVLVYMHVYLRCVCVCKLKKKCDAQPTKGVKIHVLLTFGLLPYNKSIQLFEGNYECRTSCYPFFNLTPNSIKAT